MKTKFKRILIFAACLIGAIGMFLLGVMTERKWAANRFETDGRRQLGEIISGSREQEGNLTIDINELGFHEALQSSRQTRDERTFTFNDNSKPANEKGAVAKGQHGASPQSRSTMHTDMPAMAKKAFFIQLGAFKNNENAGKAISYFNGRGFRAKMIKRNDSINGLHFKVGMGPFDDHGEASAIIKKLKQQNIPHFIVYQSSE